MTGDGVRLAPCRRPAARARLPGVVSVLAWLTAITLVAAAWVWAPQLARLAGVPLDAAWSDRWSNVDAADANPPTVRLDDCDLATRACSALWSAPGAPEGPASAPVWEATLRLSPQPVPMLAPITIMLRLSPVQPASTGAPHSGTIADDDALPWPATLDVDFSGVEMFMGINRATLTRQTDDAHPMGDDAAASAHLAGDPAAVTYRGVMTLPLCTSQRMTWNVTVFDADRQRPLGRFALTTDRAHSGWSESGRRALDALIDARRRDADAGHDGPAHGVPGRDALAPANAHREAVQP